LFTASVVNNHKHRTVQRLGNGLNEPEIFVRFPAITTGFSLMPSFQSGSRMALCSYEIRTGAYSNGGGQDSA